jgi:hypothetical protein
MDVAPRADAPRIRTGISTARHPAAEAVSHPDHSVADGKQNPPA